MTMTDPRLAPLAAALIKGSYLNGSWFDHEEECAAAILAALPPDWGMPPKLRRNAIMVEQEALIESQQAEIARLRAIEEAARVAVAELERPTELHDYRGGYHRSPDCPGCLLLAALRAALWSER